MRLALAASCVSFCAGAAAAQTAQGAQTAQEHKYPITLTAVAQYDSNVAGASAALAAQRGLQQEDFHFRPSAELDIAKKIGIFDASLTGLVGYNFYARNTRLNREQIDVNGAVAANLARCQVNLTSGLSRRQSDLTEIAIVAGAGTGVVQNVETQVHYGVDAGCGGDIGLRPTLGIERETGTNTALPRKFSNFERMGYTAGLRYAQPAFGKLSLIGSIQDVDYPNRPPVSGGEDGYASKAIGVLFERNIGANLVGAVQVNYNNLRPRRPGVATFSGITYNADLTATFADRLQLHALVTRATLPSLQSDAAYSVQTSYGLDATYAASKRLQFGLGGEYKKRRYPGAGVLPGFALTDDDRKVLNGNVTLRPNERLSFVLGGTYVTRDSPNTIYNSENTGASLSVSLAL